MLHRRLYPNMRGRGATVEPTAEFAQLQLGFVDHIQWRYEVIRPLVLFGDRTPRNARMKPTPTPTPSGRCAAGSGSRACWGSSRIVGSASARAPRVPEAVREEWTGSRRSTTDSTTANSRVSCSSSLGCPSTTRPSKRSGSQCRHLSGTPTLWDYHAQPDRYQARVQVITLYYSGLGKN